MSGYPLLFALITSAVAAALNVFHKPFFELRKNLLASLLLAVVCVPLSLVAVDLFYASSFANAVIGGNGLSDGIIVSTLYAPLGCAAVFSALTYLSQMALLIRKFNVAALTTKPQAGSSFEFSELPNSQSSNSK